MPNFLITAPDGTKYDVTGPEGATEQDALAQVMAQHPAQQQAQQQAQSAETQMNNIGAETTQDANRPAGYNVPTPLTPKSALNAAGNVGLGILNSIAGAPGDAESLIRLASRKGGAVSQQNMLPTTGDINSGNSVLSVMGAPQSADSAAERGIGSFLGPMTMARGLQALAPAERAMASASPLEQAAATARQSGYVIPPNMASDNPSLISQGLSAVAGKIKTQQAASVKNAEVTNALAAKSVGLPEDQPVTEAALEGVRRDAGQAYDSVRKAPIQVIPDQKFSQDVAALDSRGAAARAEVPDLVANPDLDKLTQTLGKIQQLSPSAAVDAVRSLRYQAQTNLKNYASPEKMDLGRAQSQAATALEGLLERNLQAATTARQPIGAQGGDMSALVDDLQKARATIAKTYDIQSALNDVTGNVDAQKFAALSAKGKPLTGELAQIADMATAFPKAVQNPAKFGGKENLSVLDSALAGGGALAGHPEYLGWLLARPAARSAILSNLYQNHAIPQIASGTAQAANGASLPSAIASSPILRALLLQGQLSRAIVPQGAAQ